MQDTTPTPLPRSSLGKQLQVRQENVRVEPEHQYAKIEKKPEDASGAKKHSLKSSGSTDREDPHSRENRHKSKSHRDHSRSSGSANKKNDHTHLTIKSDDEEVYSKSWFQNNSNEADQLHKKTLESEGLRHRNIQPLLASPKPPRNGMPSQSSDGASTSSSKDSSPPSYTSNGNAPWGNASQTLKEMLANVNPPKTIANSWSKFKTKVAYPVQQRAFIIPSIAFITFMASYSILMPKYYASIQNLIKDPLLSIPIIIASVLFAASMMAFISNLQDTRIKKTATQGDNEVFAKMKRINNEKCIRSIELDLSNNTHYTLLDGRKYKTLAFKKLALTLNRPLICAEMAACVTLTSTYLLTQYFEIGFKNLADSLSTFNTNNVELIGFTVAASVLLALFTCSFIHYYRKECVEGLELKKCPRKIESFNEEFIGEAEVCYNDKKTLSSGKHSEGKAASLTISQAIVEYYNSKAVIVAS